MDRSSPTRNMSFAIVSIMALLVSTVITTNKVDLIAPFGEITSAITTTINSSIGLEKTEVVDSEVIEPLAEPAIKKVAKSVPKDDVQCMAENIYHEAGNQSYAGKVAVGQVVLNRAKSGSFPKSVCGVIYEGSQNSRTGICQFEWVCSGKGAPNRDSANWKQSLEVAKELLTTESIDITDGAKYFHAARISPIWSKTKRKVAQIDDHIFYR